MNEATEIVHKQVIPLSIGTGRQEYNLELLSCDKILKFGFQKRANAMVPRNLWVDDLVVWYSTKTSRSYPSHLVKLVILYTGREFEKDLQWMDTVIHPATDLVFHIFKA